MTSDGGVIDEFADGDGDKISVDVAGPNVYLTASSHGFHACVRLDAELRDRFAKAWAEAERQAEAAAEPVLEVGMLQVGETELWCGLDGCINGPGEHQWHITCQPRAEAAQP